MSQEEMYRFNQEAAKSPEMQKYLDLVFQDVIDRLSVEINGNLESGIEGLSSRLYLYATSKGYVYDNAEAMMNLEKAFPGFRDQIHAALQEAMLGYQQKLLKQAK